MPASPPKADRRRLLAGFAAAAALTAPAHADQGLQTTQALERRVMLQAPVALDPSLPTKLNPTGRQIVLTVPVKDGNIYLGDISLTILPNDQLALPAQRLINLLSNVLDPQSLRALQARSSTSVSLTPADFASSGVDLRYNPQTLELNLIIAAERRGVRTVQVSPLDRDRIGTFAAPAKFSTYLNIRGALDYLHAGSDVGFSSPIFSLDGATRIGRIVAEGEAIWQSGSTGVDFQRLGSRLVFDDEANLVRWTAGDLQTVSRGFQAAPNIAGLSIFRSYSVLQPQQIIRPRGDRSFRLDRNSTVEVQVNGQIVRRLQLTPGNYDLRDFPFTQGANDIRLSVLDDTGRSELLRFNLFLDQSQLAKGLSEFGIYAGVLSPRGASGPFYSDDWAFTSFYRRGITDWLTMGGNFQADKTSRMGGIEVVTATRLGSFAGNVSFSGINRFGAGYAGTLTFQRLIQRRNGQADSFTLFAETRSSRFGPIGTIAPDNLFRAELGGGFSHAFDERLYGSVDARYSVGRGNQPDLHSYRVSGGYRISQTANLTGDVRWERDSFGSRFGALVSLLVRLGRYSSLRSDYETKDNRARASFQTLHGQGVGSYNLTADVERSDRGSGFNFNGNYYANRAELGVSHFGTFDGTFGALTSQRTSLRFGSAVALADGAISVGRPIYDSFAIVKPHHTFENADVLIEPTPFGFTANSGIMGAAMQPSLSSYAERTITVDAPTAPGGVDLGQGSFRLLPPYRSGYKLIVGSDYSITVMGKMFDAEGEPVSLVTGGATELAHPERTPVTVFTNRDGRFAVTGLAPGKWRIDMLDAKKSNFTITISDTAKGLVPLKELQSGKD